MTELVEQWRPIEGYEGLYEVSDLGRVRRVKGYDSLGHLRNERILSLGTTQDGYFKVGLHKEGKEKTFKVHRLVGQAFIPNPEGLPQINHRDEDKTNNRVDNLEWCDRKYNNSYGTRTERAAKNMVQAKIRKGLYDPEMCGLDKKEYYRMYKRKYRRRKKQKQTT